LNQQLTWARKIAMSDRKTTNIMDCINKGPIWINNDNWNQMIKDIWFTPEFQRKSKSVRNNQLTETYGILSTHSEGTVSFISYQASMVWIFLFVIMNLKFLYLYFVIYIIWLIARKNRWKRTFMGWCVFDIASELL
jgi:hypothetical protein